MRLEMKDVKALPQKSIYYKAFLLDEMGVEHQDLVGRFSTFEEACKECERWANEEVEDGGWYRIYQLIRIDNHSYAKKCWESSCDGWEEVEW